MAQDANELFETVEQSPWSGALRAVTRLASIRGFPPFFASAAAEIARIFDAEGAALITCQQPGWLQYRLFYGLDALYSERIRDLRFRDDEGTVGRAITTNTALFTADYPHSAEAMPAFVECGLLANFVVPIPGPHGPLGALAIAWTRRFPVSPDPFQRLVAEMFASLIGAALYREQLETQLRQDSLHDSLTGLPNRRMLVTRLLEACERARRRQRLLVVAMIDLDGFKAINDDLGHEAGDRLLISCAHHIQEVVRTIDTVARLGGDEFILVFEDIRSIEDAEVMLTRVIRVLRIRTRVDQHAREIRASIGATVFPLDDSDPETLLRHADQTMYQAKRAGGDNFLFYDTQPDNERMALQHIREELAGAVKNGELSLYYQPVIDISSGRLMGAEALIRWNHPRRGLLAPAAFLPAIEDDPLMVQVGIWTVREVLSQMRHWQSAAAFFHVAINIGGRFLETTDFLRLLREALAYGGPVNVSYLQLEIVERAGLTDTPRVRQIVHECRLLGIHTWFDDFGTGHASLSSLREIPVAGIKIDRQFVTNIVSTPSDRAIVEGLLSIARAFSLQVIAEGVETEPQMTLLKGMGCAMAQGYYIARPMTASAFDAWRDAR